MYMDFNEDELELYNEYLTFIRRMMVDELSLKNENLTDIEFFDIKKLNDGRWKFLCFVFEKLTDGHKKDALIYEAIGYETWIKMVKRDNVLNELMTNNYYQKNKEKFKEKRMAMSDAEKQWRKEYAAKYYQENKDELLNYSKEYKRIKKEQWNNYQKEWKKRKYWERKNNENG